MATIISSSEAQKMKPKFESTYKIPEGGAIAHNVVCYFAVNMTNPNGDVDNEGRPRVAPDGSFGYATPDSVKRKVRDVYVHHRQGIDGEEILVQSGTSRESIVTRDANELGIDLKNAVALPADEKKAAYNNLIDHLNQKYVDARMFGVTMTTFAKNKFGDGKMHGGITFSFPESVDPVEIVESGIEPSQLASDEEAQDKNNTLGRNYVVKFGVYKFAIRVNPYFANEAGVTEADIQNLLNIVEKYLYPENTSATRTGIKMIKMVDFTQPGALRQFPGEELEDRVICRHKDGVSIPQKVDDYEFEIVADDIPDYVTIIERI